MARRAKPGDKGEKVTNLTDAKDLIRNAVPEIINIDEKIKNLRDRRNELRSAVQAAGVTKGAFDLALKFRKMDPEDRQAFDEGFVIAREAVGLRVQRGLFEALNDDDDAEEGNGRPTRHGNGSSAAAAPDAL